MAGSELAFVLRGFGTSSRLCFAAFSPPQKQQPLPLPLPLPQPLSQPLPLPHFYTLAHLHTYTLTHLHTYTLAHLYTYTLLQQQPQPPPPPHSVAILAQVADNHPIFGGLGGVQLATCSRHTVHSVVSGSLVFVIMLRAVFFGAVCSATAASLCGRMRRTQFEVSGFILLFALWYHALMDDAVIVPKPCLEVTKVCAVDCLPALLVNSTVTECLYVSDDSAQGLFGDFWDGFGGLPDSVVGFLVTRVSFPAAAMLLFYAFSLKCCDFMGGLGFQLERGLALLAALICLRLVVAGSGYWVLGFLFDFPESGKSACFGLGKDKDIPLCSPQMCVSILDPQVGGGLTILWSSLVLSSCARSRMRSSVWSASVLARCLRQVVGSSLPYELHGVTRAVHVVLRLVFDRGR